MFLLPLAVLAKSLEPEALLATVAKRVDIIEDRAERSNVAACLQLLAGINFDSLAEAEAWLEGSR